MTTYDIYFNSGGGDPGTHFTNGDNVSMLEITNSDQDYYQSAVLTIFDDDTSISVGNNVLIEIDNINQFNGYVSRIQRSIDAGVEYKTYQLIGKTYDLWRYFTDNDVTYTGYTTYIASSLVGRFCPGITCNAIEPYEGTDITTEIDFSNMKVGDCLVSLTDYDNYKFYVDSNGILNYFNPPSSQYLTTFTESDLISMDPIEQADEDITNVCLVIGPTPDFVSTTEVSDTYKYKRSFPNEIYVAQKFTAASSRLSSVKLYLGHSEGDNEPDNLFFEIWGASSTPIFNDTFDNGDYLNDGTNINLETSNGKLRLTYTDINSIYNNGATNEDYHVPFFMFKPTANCCLRRTRLYISNDLPYYNQVVNTICRSGSDGFPSLDEVIASGMITDVNSTYTWYALDFEDFPALISGITYSCVWNNDWTLDGEASHLLPLRKFNASEENLTVKGGHKGTLTSPGSWTSAGNTLTTCYVYLSVFPTSGSIQSISTGIDCQYMLADWTAYKSGSFIKISGTNNGGATWSGLTDNTWMTFGSESSDGVILKYIFSSNGFFTPMLDSVNLEIGDSAGSSASYPRSSNKVVHSDDLIFTSSDFPYPPSYNSWKAYTNPKLRLVEDNSYYMIMKYPSGSSKYWDYYYNPTVDIASGNISYSWDSGATWSSNSDYSYYDYLGLNDISISDPGIYPTDKILVSMWSTSSFAGTLEKLYVKSVSPSYISYHLLRGAVYKSSNTGDYELIAQTESMNAADDRPGGTWVGDFGPSAMLADTWYFIAVWGACEGPSTFNPICYCQPPDFTGRTWYDTSRDYSASSNGDFSLYPTLITETSLDNEFTKYNWESVYAWASIVKDNEEGIPGGSMVYKLGWGGDTDTIRAVASNQTSISNYGRHLKRIDDSTITTLYQAELRAEREVSQNSIPKKGTLVVNGVSNMGLDYKFSSNFTNFGINESHDIVSYTQRIDENGFTTSINYGKQPYDIVSDVTRLQKEVYG